MYSEHDWWLYPGPPVQQCVRKNNTEPGNAASPFNEYDFQSTAAFHTEESEVDEDGIAWPKGDWENGEEGEAAAEAAVGEKGSRGNIREEDGGPQEHTQDQDSWTEVRTTEGRTYYWNRASGATQWEPPDRFRRPGELKRCQNAAKTVLKRLQQGTLWDTLVPKRSQRAPRAPDIEKPRVFLCFS